VAARFSSQELRKTKAPQYLLRFAFGGVVAVVAFSIGQAFGPRVGGLFLAFPALLPAGLTLIKRHDGRNAAADDARGALLGSIAMVAFACIVFCSCELLGAWSLPLALLGWIVVSVGAWWLVYGRKARA
jgi:hypothetical protein